MKQLAIASGKGGAGKTTVSVNLTHALSQRHSVQYIDCDVEAPNGGIFLRPKITGVETVARPVPVIDYSLCQHCGECSAFCEFNAIAALPRGTIVYPELCRGCGGCLQVCPRGAVTEQLRRVGEVRFGRADRAGYAAGELVVREIATIPVIRAVRKKTGGAELAVLDAPPGTACPMVATVRGADAVLLVTDPTPFALHDLRLAADVVRALHLRAGVVINRASLGRDRNVEKYCKEANLPIWGRIPDDRRVAEAYSEGRLIPDSARPARRAIEELAETIEDLVLA